MSQSRLTPDDASNGASAAAPTTVEGEGRLGERPPPHPEEDDDVFARAVGLAEPPRKRDRRQRRTVDPNRPTVTPADAERLLRESTAPQDAVVVPASPAPPEPAAPVPTTSRPSWLERRRARVRRTRLTIRHVDPWSVLKVSVFVYAVLYVAATLAGVLLWSAAVRSGVIGNIESFIQDVGAFEVWEFNGDEIFRRGTIIGAVLAVAGVAFNVLMAIVFNLISDIVGGVRVTILEEDGLQQPTL